MLNFVSALGSEALLEILLKSKDATAIYTGEDLKIQLVNGAMLEIWGKDASVHGLPFEVAIPEMEGQPFTELLKDVWRTGETYTARDTPATLEINKQLKTSYFDFIYRAIHDGNGEIQCILHTATDVTDRMAAWEMVRQKEAREREINQQLETSNLALERSVQDLQALNEEYEATNEELHSTIEELAAINEEYQATNEELQSTLEEVAKLNWEYNSANEQLSMTADKLRESQQNLAMAMQAARLGSYDLDLETGLMECSEQCKLNFGRPLDARFDMADLVECILPAYRDGVLDNINSSVEKHCLYQSEYQISHPDGSLHWIQANGSPKYDATGKPVRMVGVTQLITQKKDLELRKEEFLSVASHELKTPLTVLKANLQLMNRIREKIDNPVLIRLIETCHSSMARIDKMIAELLDMGKYSKGEVALSKSSFDLAALLRDCSGHLSNSEQQKIHIRAETLFLQADAFRVEQVVINFLNNAMRYAPESKQVRIQLSQLGDYARVSVSDQGKGIPEEQAAMLFDRYYQAAKQGAAQQGLGLGLYISSEIIKRHGGEIGVESLPNEGSSFWFTLPLKA